MIKWVVCPRSIKSKTDGDVHYIGVAQLVRLYRLRPNEWVTEDKAQGLDHLPRLYPDYHGNYGRPDDIAD